MKERNLTDKILIAFSVSVSLLVGIVVLGLFLLALVWLAIYNLWYSFSVFILKMVAKGGVENMSQPDIKSTNRNIANL